MAWNARIAVTLIAGGKGRMVALGMVFFRPRESLNATQLGCALMSSQLAIPSVVRPDEVFREKSLGGAIELCAKAGGYSFDKSLQLELGVDKAQFSRWQSGTEGVVWPKLQKLMDTCGNLAPVL